MGTGLEPSQLLVVIQQYIVRIPSSKYLQNKQQNNYDVRSTLCPHILGTPPLPPTLTLQLMYFVCETQQTVRSYLSQLLHSDHPVPITIKEFEGLLQAVDVLPGELPVRAESLSVPGHSWAGSASITL